MKLKAYDKDLDKWFDVGRVNFDKETGDVDSVYILSHGYHYRVSDKDGVELKWIVEPADRVVVELMPSPSFEGLEATKIISESKLKELAESGD